MATTNAPSVANAPEGGEAKGVGSGGGLGDARAQWKARLRTLIADKNGDDMPDFNEYLESLAESYYDEPIASGGKPETPEEAVWNEWQTAS